MTFDYINPTLQAPKNRQYKEDFLSVSKFWNFDVARKSIFIDRLDLKWCRWIAESPSYPTAPKFCSGGHCKCISWSLWKMVETQQNLNKFENNQSLGACNIQLVYCNYFFRPNLLFWSWNCLKAIKEKTPGVHVKPLRAGSTILTGVGRIFLKRPGTYEKEKISTFRCCRSWYYHITESTRKTPESPHAICVGVESVSRVHKRHTFFDFVFDRRVRTVLETGTRDKILGPL